MSGTRQTRWTCCMKDTPYPQRKPLKWEVVADHPLKPSVIMMSESRTIRKIIGGSTASSTGSSTPSCDLFNTTFDGTDPLSQFANQELDPLSKMVADQWDPPVKSRRKSHETQMSQEDFLEPWSARRSAVLSRFTTSEKLSIVTSFLAGGEKIIVKAQSTLVDKVKNRLEQLDDFEEGSVRQMLDLTQQEYMSRIEQLNQELIQAWHGDQRVKALKIAIQCSKLLADTAVMQFYPSKFVLVTDILDIFGKLVYERLRTKSDYYISGSNVPSELPVNFTPDMVPETAKETCRNWFYKIASIRELLPRLYVEMAILKSYSYLTTSEFSLAVLRLTRMIRGIGNPLVAVYARCYLCRVAMAVLGSNHEYLKENFYDFLAVYDQVFCPTMRLEFTEQRLNISAYLSLYTPALDWILQGVAAKASESLLDEILIKCKEKKNSGLLLNTIIASFKPMYIANRALQFVNLLTSCQDEGFPQYQLFRTLGLCLTLADPPADDRLSVLNQVWRVVAALPQPAHYIACAEVWVQYAVMHFGSREVNTFLHDIIRHMTPNRAYEQHYPQLQAVMERIVAHSKDLEILMTLDNFMPLLDLFQKDTVRVDVCKNIMSAHRNLQDTNSNDPVVTNALMFMCRIMHDSVNALTVEDEIRQISALISCFIKRINYGRDFEQQLSFYVEARSSFTNLDNVHAQLVQCVNKLSIDTRKIVKGCHTRKTAAFVRACDAYCYITIPSIASVSCKLDLYLMTGQVALLNQCLGQADACFKAALSLIPDLPKTIEIEGKQKSTEPYLVSYMCNFLSTLLVVPDCPDQGILFLTRGLLNVLQHYSFDPHSCARSNVYVHVIDLLSAAAQDRYSYHVEGVDSNDTLYGSDPKFISEINKLCSMVVDEILAHLQYLGSNNLLLQQSQLTLDLFRRVLSCSDLAQPNMSQLALNLWYLALKNRDNADIKQAVSILKYFDKKASRTKDDALKSVITTIHQKSKGTSV